MEKTRSYDPQITACGNGQFECESSSGETVYTVDLEAGTCSCPDHCYRGGRECKHLRWVRLRSYCMALEAARQLRPEALRLHATRADLRDEVIDAIWIVLAAREGERDRSEVLQAA
jgi:hypothetical protein